MTGVSKNWGLTLAERNIDHYPLLIKTIFLPEGPKVSVSALTMAWPRAALPQPLSLGSKYQLELYRKAFIKSLSSTSVSPLFCWSRKC